MKRNFERFLYRRKIEDPAGYFSRKGITSDEQLAAWCENNGIEKPAAPVFAEVPASGSTESSAKKSVAKENWHVPAAERPLKKPTAKRKTATKKKASK